MELTDEERQNIILNYLLSKGQATQEEVIEFACMVEEDILRGRAWETFASIRLPRNIAEELEL